MKIYKRMISMVLVVLMLIAPIQVMNTKDTIKASSISDFLSVKPTLSSGKATLKILNADKSGYTYSKSVGGCNIKAKLTVTGLRKKVDVIKDITWYNTSKTIYQTTKINKKVTSLTTNLSTTLKNVDRDNYYCEIHIRRDDTDYYIKSNTVNAKIVLDTSLYVGMIESTASSVSGKLLNSSSVINNNKGKLHVRYSNNIEFSVPKIHENIQTEVKVGSPKFYLGNTKAKKILPKGITKSISTRYISNNRFCLNTTDITDRYFKDNASNNPYIEIPVNIKYKITSGNKTKTLTKRVKVVISK